MGISTIIQEAKLGDAPLCARCKKPMRFVAQGYSDELTSVVNLYHCDDPCWTQKRVRVATPNAKLSAGERREEHP